MKAEGKPETGNSSLGSARFAAPRAGRNEADVQVQAAELSHLWSAVRLRLSMLEPDDPAAELPVAQLRVCSLLAEDPRLISSLAKEFGITGSAATQIVDRLETAGMVERVAGMEDRRTRQVRLTAHGAEMMRTRRECRVQRVAEVLSALAPCEREAVLEALRTLLGAACEVACPEGAKDLSAEL